MGGSPRNLHRETEFARDEVMKWVVYIGDKESIDLDVHGYRYIFRRGVRRRVHTDAALFLRRNSSFEIIGDVDSFALSVHPSDRFVCTYPKSGTNWIGMFLGALISFERRRVCWPEFSFYPFRSYIPDANYWRSNDLPLETDFVSCSIVPSFTVHSGPFDLSKFKSGNKIIHVVRDPRDVAVSFYYHHKRETPGFSRSMSDFIQGWSNEQHWLRFVMDWYFPNMEFGVPGMHPEGLQVLTLRYEDLHEDIWNGSYSSFRKAAEFWNLYSDEDVFRWALRVSSFSYMQKMEHSTLFPKARADGSIPFCRKGKVGGWKNTLSLASVNQIEAALDRGMVLFGYS